MSVGACNYLVMFRAGAGCPTNTKESPNLKLQFGGIAAAFGIWRLEFLWILVFGIWCLVQRSIGMVKT